MIQQESKGEVRTNNWENKSKAQLSDKQQALLDKRKAKAKKCKEESNQMILSETMHVWNPFISLKDVK